MNTAIRSIAFLCALAAGLSACGPEDVSAPIEARGEDGQALILGNAGRDIRISSANRVSFEACDVSFPINVAASSALDFVGLDLDGVDDLDVELFGIDADGLETALDVQAGLIDADLLSDVRTALSPRLGVGAGRLPRLSPVGLSGAIGTTWSGLGTSLQTGRLMGPSWSISDRALVFSGLRDRSLTQVMVRAHFRSSSQASLSRIRAFAGIGTGRIGGAAFHVPLVPSTACGPGTAGSVAFRQPLFITPRAPFAVDGCAAQLGLGLQSLGDDIDGIAVHVPFSTNLTSSLLGFGAGGVLSPLDVDARLVDDALLGNVRTRLGLDTISEFEFWDLEDRILDLDDDVLGDLCGIAGIDAGSLASLRLENEAMLRQRLLLGLNVARSSRLGGSVLMFSNLTDLSRARRFGLDLSFEAERLHLASTLPVNVFAIGTRATFGRGLFNPTFAGCGASTIVPPMFRGIGRSSIGGISPLH